MDLGHEPESPWQDDHDVLPTDAGAVVAGYDGYISDGIINNEFSPELGMSHEDAFDAAAIDHSDQDDYDDCGMPTGDFSTLDEKDRWRPWLAVFGPSLIRNLRWALNNRVSLSLDAIALALLTGRYLDDEDVPSYPAP